MIFSMSMVTLANRFRNLKYKLILSPLRMGISPKHLKLIGGIVYQTKGDSNLKPYYLYGILQKVYFRQQFE